MAARPVLVIALFLTAAVPCRAQTPTQHDDGAADRLRQDAPHIAIAVHYEVHRDHLRYTFENRSNIDTEALVPHRFTQSYVANNQWVVASARYPLGHDWMQTEFALTPERQTPGSDVDTFYDPNNDVVASGTAGEVLMRSLRFTHWSEARLAGLQWRAGYRYRRDRSQFLPTDRVLTHSNPPSEVRSPTFGHETTFSRVHEIPVEVSTASSLSTTWTLNVGADISPLVWARLTTLLPDKYPGQEIAFDAKAIGGGARIQIVRERGWPVVLSLHYGRTWSYNASRQFSRDALEASIRIGLGR